MLEDVVRPRPTFSRYQREDFLALARLPLEERNRIGLFVGHLRMGMSEHVLRNTKWVTMLRHDTHSIESRRVATGRKRGRTPGFMALRPGCPLSSR